MDLFGIFSAFGLSASAGLNAYIPLLSIALLAKYTDLIKLGEPWNAITSWWIIGLLVLLSLIEFFADKIPAVNHINDIVMTFVRPAAGAIAFASSARVITEVNPVLSLGLGFVVAGGVHALKSAAIRPVVTATTGGAGNVPVSIAEDIISTIVSIISVILPVLIACFLIIATAFVIWWLWRHPRRAAPTT
jgi:hypothetical protein